MDSHPAVWYFLGISPTDPNRSVVWSPENIDKPQPGVLLIWDKVYGLKNSDARLSIPLEKIRAAGWIELQDTSSIIEYVEGDDTWHIFLSPASSGS